MTDDRADQLRALERMIESCRTKAKAYGVPALIPILHRAGLSLSDHAARASDAPRTLPTRALSVPRGRPVRH